MLQEDVFLSGLADIRDAKSTSDGGVFSWIVNDLLVYTQLVGS